MIITTEIRQAAIRTANNNGILAAYREVKRQEAQERLTARQALKPEQQLARLDRRLGRGKGARKERTRLWEQMVAAHYPLDVLNKWRYSTPACRQERYSIAL
jgi:hypothetical protein